ncbi:MAG: hypothetical protein ACTSVE_04770 [Candidatus Helarchaeota archaeon]
MTDLSSKKKILIILLISVELFFYALLNLLLLAAMNESGDSYLLFYTYFSKIDIVGYSIIREFSSLIIPISVLMLIIIKTPNFQSKFDACKLLLLIAFLLTLINTITITLFSIISNPFTALISINVLIITIITAALNFLTFLILQLSQIDSE